jgi:cysteine desulfuration protein SufE
MKNQFFDRLFFLKEKFHLLSTNEEKYSYLIDLGRALPPYPEALRTPERIVSGCQSTLYLDAEMDPLGALLFQATSDALISQGLAALLIQVYSDLAPEIILLNPPLFLHELGLFASLSPHRSNGLASIYARMKEEAIKQIKIKNLIHSFS